MRHWTEDELLEHMYGLKDADAHFTSCAACRERALEVSAARQTAVQAPDVSDEFLAAQRRRIYERLRSPLHRWHPLRWAVSAVATLALLLALTFYRDKPAAPSRDDQFFAELSSLAQTPAPRAVQPIESLVGDDAQE